MKLHKVIQLIYQKPSYNFHKGLLILVFILFHSSRPAISAVRISAVLIAARFFILTWHVLLRRNRSALPNFFCICNSTIILAKRTECEEVHQELQKDGRPGECDSIYEIWVFTVLCGQGPSGKVGFVSCEVVSFPPHDVIIVGLPCCQGRFWRSHCSLV